MSLVKLKKPLLKVEDFKSDFFQTKARSCLIPVKNNFFRVNISSLDINPDDFRVHVFIQVNLLEKKSENNYTIMANVLNRELTFKYNVPIAEILTDAVGIINGVLDKLGD